MGRRQRTFARIALVLPTEYAYARAVLRGIIAATRERNLYAAGRAAPEGRGKRNGRTAVEALPWLFNVFRGIYGHSSKYLARWFADWNPDGVICQIYDDRLANVYRQTRRPVVELFESRPESEFPRILPDDVATGELAARHFLERGFRHFAFFGAPWMLWSGEREQGFKREIDRTFRQRRDSRPHTYHSHGAAGAGRDTTIAAPAMAASQKERSDAMGAWLAALPRPVAVFAANDLWGSELVQAARQRNLHVPGEVAILGVDNEELLCEIAHPPLSSIRIGAEQIGRAAVSVLEQLMSGRKPPRHIPRIGPMEVVTRQSTDVLAVEDEDVATAIQHIRRHAVEGISVKQLLEIVPVNRRTLERRFMAVLGHTPLDEIRRVRLDRAKVLLQTDLPVYEVAQRSGFATPEYLATSFLQATGMTPTEYRRQFGPRSRWEHLPPSVAD
jgi:LacI family transcriptional regulator